MNLHRSYFITCRRAKLLYLLVLLIMATTFPLSMAKADITLISGLMRQTNQPQQSGNSNPFWIIWVVK